MNQNVLSIVQFLPHLWKELDQRNKGHFSYPTNVQFKWVFIAKEGRPVEVYSYHSDIYFQAASSIREQWPTSPVQTLS